MLIAIFLGVAVSDCLFFYCWLFLSADLDNHLYFPFHRHPMRQAPLFFFFDGKTIRLTLVIVFSALFLVFYGFSDALFCAFHCLFSFMSSLSFFF